MRIYCSSTCLYAKSSSGLWINQTIAQTIDTDDAEDMRNGFKNRIYNSRGVYTPRRWKYMISGLDKKV